MADYSRLLADRATNAKCAKRYRERNREALRAKARARYLKIKDDPTFKAKRNIWQKNNPACAKRYRERNREAIRARNRDRYHKIKNDPIFKAKRKIWRERYLTYDAMHKEYRAAADRHRAVEGKNILLGTQARREA